MLGLGCIPYVGHCPQRVPCKDSEWLRDCWCQDGPLAAATYLILPRIPDSTTTQQVNQVPHEPILRPTSCVNHHKCHFNPLYSCAVNISNKLDRKVGVLPHGKHCGFAALPRQSRVFGKLLVLSCRSCLGKTTSSAHVMKSLPRG